MRDTPSWDFCWYLRWDELPNPPRPPLVDGRADNYADRYAPYAYTGNADFNVRSFRATNVLRWGYRPGSALFVVWQQNKSDSGDQGDFNFGRDFSGVFTAPTHNVFLVKFSYWLNM